MTKLTQEKAAAVTAAFDATKKCAQVAWDAPWLEPKEVYALLWHPDSKLPHVELLRNMVEASWKSFAKGAPSRWTVLAVGPYEYVTEAAEALAQML